jgi:hypothetical protein
MADDVAIRASNQEDIEYRQGRDVLQDERNAVIDEQTTQQFNISMKNAGYELETLEETKAVRVAIDSLSQYSSVDQAMASPEYKNLPTSQKAAVAGALTGVANAQMLAATAGIKKQFSKATDIGGVIGIYNDDEALTEGTTMEGVELEDGSYRLDTYQDQLPPDGDEGPSQTRESALSGSMTFRDAETADLYLRQKALDPVTGAMYYQQQKAAVAAVAAEQLEAAAGNQVKALDSLIKMRIEFNSQEGAFYALPQEEKEEEWAKVVTMYAGILTPEQMKAQIGGLKDGPEPEGGGNWYTNLISRDAEGETTEGETTEGDPEPPIRYIGEPVVGAAIGLGGVIRDTASELGRAAYRQGVQPFVNVGGAALNALGVPDGAAERLNNTFGRRPQARGLTPGK